MLKSLCCSLALAAAGSGSGDALHTTATASGDLGPIYFVLVDRFANGKPANDRDVAVTDPSAWHGGDLRGIQDRLDRLAQLGVETLWLSPIFRSRRAPFFGHGAFHGYWVENLDELDPRFGTEAELRELVTAAHARGMRVLLDLVVNHLAPEAPLTRLRPEWFHRRGPIRDWSSSEDLEQGDVHGLPDLAQENPAVRDYLLIRSQAWLERTGADGYRLDAVKHVPTAFWRDLVGELGTRGRPPFLVGEIFDGAPGALDARWRETGFTHVFDFPLAFALRDAFCTGAPATDIAVVLSEDRRYPAPERLVTFLDNHDLPRLASVCGNDLARMQAALQALFVLRGVPAIQYGTEHALAGREEPHNRGDMDHVAAAHHVLRATIAGAAATRRQHAVLRAGSTHVLHADASLLVLLRVLGDDAAVVALNTGAGPRTMSATWLRGTSPVAPVVGASRLVTGDVTLPAGTHAWRVRLEELAMGAPTGGRRAVHFVLAGGPANGPSFSHVAGSGAELGDWAPGRGPRLQHGRTEVVLPWNSVVAFKLVRPDPATGWTWGPMRNNYLRVPAGEGPWVVTLRPDGSLE